jgi:hypothetical protein
MNINVAFRFFNLKGFRILMFILNKYTEVNLILEPQVKKLNFLKSFNKNDEWLDKLIIAL